MTAHSRVAGTKGRSATVVTAPVLLTLVAAILFGTSGCGEPAVPLARLESMRGHVSVNSVAARSGLALSAGDLIEAAAAAVCEIRFADRSLARILGQGSDGTSLKLVETRKGTLRTTLLLAQGVIGMAVAAGEKGSTRYEVETANCTASVEGTVFLVAHRARRTEVLVAAGTVVVTNSLGPPLRVETGRAATVEEGAPPRLDPGSYNPKEGLGEQVERLLQDATSSRVIEKHDGRGPTPTPTPSPGR
ncbi:MAG: FecR domain-containing protein [Candidatus Riflebacteria bacterium]|nr:FecR domain-containing protein [Candidatus Riflebacteria bacterium]